MAALSSIDLILDEVTEAQIRRQWHALEFAGFSSLAAHKAGSNRPHITLVAGSPPLNVEGPVGDPFFPLHVTIGPPVLFGSGDRRVLARSVTPTVALLDLHAAVYTATTVAAAKIAKTAATAEPHEPAFAVEPHTKPDAWIPHVTLARRLRLDSLAEALRLIDIRHDQGPDDDIHSETIQGEITGMRLWDPLKGTAIMLGGRATSGAVNPARGPALSPRE